LRVDQFLPHLGRDDAIGNHVLRIQRVLKEHFGTSDIYVGSADAALRRLVKPYRSFDAKNGSAVIYHASIGTPVAYYLMKLQSPLIVDYHNVTPMRFFAKYEPRIAAQLFAGRVECGLFARKAALGLADSQYSTRELDSMGYAKTATIPILIDFSRYEQAPDGKLLRELAGSKKGTDILFVGRLSPNKRQEDLIKTFALYRRHFNPGARLFLVGPASSARYRDSLLAFVRRLAIEDVVFAGAVPFAHLLAYYRTADVYLSLSEHEGFCVPLLEAMSLHLPVIAFDAAAVPETLGEAGVLIREKNYEEIAALIDLVCRSDELRGRLVRAGQQRVDHYRPEPHEQRFVELLESVLL